MLNPTTVEKNQVFLCNSCGDFVMPKAGFEGLVGTNVQGPSLVPPGAGGAVMRDESSKCKKEAGSATLGTPKAKLGGQTHSKDEGHAHNCPGCHGEMSRANVKGADIEFCPGCNIVHSDRASFSFIVDSEPGNKAVNETLLKLDVARNVNNAVHGTKVSDVSVDDIFVLYKNGILMTSWTTDVPEEMDKEILGSMLMAITNFVQSSFKTMGKGKMLSSIRFEDKEIAFEHGNHIVVAMTLRGTLGSEARKKLQSTIKEVESTHSGVLQSWDGCLDTVGGIMGSFKHFIDPLRTSN
jgi:Zn-finger nucleic acid-binding protein